MWCSSTALLYVPCKKSVGKWEIDPRKIVAHENFILKLCTRDYAREITRHTHFYFHMSCRQSVGGSEKNQFVGDEIRMQTWRRTELLQMLGVITFGSHSHVGSQALGKVCHRLVDMFLWQLFPEGLQGNFQLIGRLRLWWSLWYFFSMVPQM